MGAALQEWLRWAGSNGVDDKPPTAPTGKDWSALREILRDYERLATATKKKSDALLSEPRHSAAWFIGKWLREIQAGEDKP